MILPRLFQGSAPAPDNWMVAGRHIDVIVLCAEEYQPDAKWFKGIEIIRCPFDDAPEISIMEHEMVKHTAGRVARRLAAKKRVLVTCRAGRNRSGLVTAYAMMMHTGCSASEAIKWIRRCRENALTNPTFVHLLLQARLRPTPSNLRAV